MKKFAEILFGLLILVVVLYLGIAFPRIYHAAIQVLIGGLAWLFILIGIGLILLGLSEFKS